MIENNTTTKTLEKNQEESFILDASLLQTPVIASILISLFWVLFLWRFWENGVESMGFNATVFGVLLLGFFLFSRKDRRVSLRGNYFWLAPMIFMLLSFSLYENPFLKNITLLIFPFLFAFFYNYSFFEQKKTQPWNDIFIMESIERFFQFIPWGKRAFFYLFDGILPGSNEKKAIFKKTILGVVLFLAIAFVIVIPLLSAADPQFQSYMDSIVFWFSGIISWTTVKKIIFMIIIAVGLLSGLCAWTQGFDFKPRYKEFRLDDIIAGIVLGGILILYIFFLGLQIGHLWVDRLPVVFEETESLVKSGFWQLLFLSILNILFFFMYYRNTKPFVQKILTVFTFASLLLLLSAGQRMVMYVLFYGLSYEKFFASYTVLFCVILFIWLIVSLFRKTKSDVVKFVLILFLWMYSVATVLPIEQTIMRANVALAQRDDSRIELNELHMLSVDVLPLVHRFIADGTLDASEWKKWLVREANRVDEKYWYEMNVQNVGK